MRTGRSGAAEALRNAFHAGLALPWERLWRPVRRAAAAVMSLPVWSVLGVLLLSQWLVVGIVARIAQHNGSYYYTGGDGTWYYTSAWVLAHGHIPQASISYGYPFLLAPLARIAGPSQIAGLPLVVAFNALVLWPIALFCVYGIGKMIGGRGFAYLATLAWTVSPLAAIPYFYGRYHGRLVDQALPSALGLVSTGDFPSLVFLIVAAYFALRAVAHRSPAAALVAGAAAGFAATVKPANLIFLPAPLAALAIARRPRELLLFGAALAPALGGLALWKYRGLGYLPLFQRPSAALATGLVTPPPLADLNIHRYVPLDWGRLRDNMYYLREYAWSLRLVTWALVAGVVALARRSAPVAVLIGGWLACFVVLKGSAGGVNISDGSFFRYMQPAFPPFFLGLVALPLLVPVLGRQLAAIGRGAGTSWPNGRGSWRVVLAVAGVTLVAPVVAIAAFHPLTVPSATRIPDVDQYAPANSFPIRKTQRTAGAVVLSWPSQGAHGARVSYTVFRMAGDGLSCRLLRHASAICNFFSNTARIELIPVGQTWRTTFLDAPPHGNWSYRVATNVAPSRHALGGDYVLLSTAVQVHIG